MAKSEARQKAYEIWLNSGGEMPLKDIAEELSVPPNKIRKWKSLDKWSVPSKVEQVERSTEDKVERSTAEQKRLERNIKRRVPPELRKTKGPPYGSKNALGNRGGKGGPFGNHFAKGHGAPKGNKNAETTGEYSAIYEDLLTDKEQEIFDSVDLDPLAQIDKTIKLLTIRERRMLENINKLKEQKTLAEFEDVLIPDKNDPEGKSSKVKSRTRYTKLLIDKIVLAEEALTRVQEKLIKAIETKHKIMKELGITDQDTLDDVIIFAPDKAPRV